MELILFYVLGLAILFGRTRLGIPCFPHGLARRTRRIGL